MTLIEASNDDEDLKFKYEKSDKEFAEWNFIYYINKLRNKTEIIF